MMSKLQHLITASFFIIFFSCCLNTGNAQNGLDTVSYVMADTTTAKQWIEEAKQLISEGKNEEALEKLNQAKVIIEQTIGKENVHYATVMHQKGRVSINTDKPDQAIALTQEALEIRLKTLGNEHADVASSYNNLGISYRSKGQYSKSIEYLEKALEIRLKILGNEHPDVASSYNNLGTSYRSIGQYSKAIEYFEKALESNLKVLGNEHPNVATSYNSLGISYNYKGEYSKSIEYFEKALEIRLKVLGNEDPDVASSYNNIGASYYSEGEYGKAIEYLKNALEIRLKLLGDEHPEVAASYSNIGVFYESKGEYSQAIEYKKKALGIFVKALGSEHPDVAGSYNNIGNSYYNQGEYSKAIEYHEKALEIRLKTLGSEHSEVAHSYLNLGNSYKSKGEYGKAIGYGEKGLRIILKVLGDEHPEVAQSYNNMGVFYDSKGEYNKALEYHEKALEIRLKLLGDEHPDVARCYNNLGVCYDYKGEHDKAIEYYEKSLEIYLKAFGNENPDVAQTYNNLGASYDFEGKYDQVIAVYLNALKALGYQSNNFQKVNSFEELLRSLGGMGKVLEKKYELSQDTSFLQQSLDYVKEALAAVDYQSASFSSESSKTNWQSENYPIYEQAISVSLLKAQVDQDQNLRKATFTYAEKSKAAQLQAQIKAADALAFAGIPDNLITKEHDLRIDITWREKQRQALLDQKKSETDTTVLRISSIVFDLKQEYEGLKKRLEIEYPDYYKAKYDLSIVSIDYVQDTLLQADQSLVEYFVGDSSLFIFLVQPDHYEVQEVKIDTSFQQWIREMTQEGIYGHYNAPKALQNNKLKERSLKTYAEAASQLYKKLIAPIQSKLTKEVIIVPDGALGYIPFEALLKQQPTDYNDLKSYQYLLQDHQISYSYSATLLKEMRDKKHRQDPSEKLLAFAPFFQGDADTLVVHVDTTDYTQVLALKDSLSALPGSGAEVKTITKSLKGASYYGKSASIAKFQELASKYRILHLSTHGKADDRVGDYAYLAFGMPDVKGEFAKLYARDLYNLSLNADLVVLSACETGIGKLQRGEGIVSLARAFAYAGAKSIMTTLWKVSDEKTKDLVISFYKYLKKGKSKDEALRLAKLEFLKKNADKPELTHPFFWAGMIGIGDMRAIR